MRGREAQPQWWAVRLAELCRADLGTLLGTSRKAMSVWRLQCTRLVVNVGLSFIRLLRPFDSPQQVAVVCSLIGTSIPLALACCLGDAPGTFREVLTAAAGAQSADPTKLRESPADGLGWRWLHESLTVRASQQQRLWVLVAAARQQHRVQDGALLFLLSRHWLRSSMVLQNRVAECEKQPGSEVLFGNLADL